jgi:hypothetical protein
LNRRGHIIGTYVGLGFYLDLLVMKGKGGNKSRDIANLVGKGVCRLRSVIPEKKRKRGATDANDG